jgi:hypothetical protein
MTKLFVKRNSKKFVVCDKVVFRERFLSKAFGLQFHKKIYDEAHVFLFDEKKKVALTMWFVFFPIDVLYLDEKKRIVEIKENFKPFANYFPKKESLFVIELPQGTIKEKKLKLNEEMIF